jgi:hypothetical protein
MDGMEQLQGDGVVLDEADVQAVVSAELDVRPYADRQNCLTASRRMCSPARSSMHFSYSRPEHTSQARFSHFGMSAPTLFRDGEEDASVESLGVCSRASAFGGRHVHERRALMLLTVD